jgi:hypothetical protein
MKRAQVFQMMNSLKLREISHNKEISGIKILEVHIQFYKFDMLMWRKEQHNSPKPFLKLMCICLLQELSQNHIQDIGIGKGSQQKLENI